MGQPPLQSERNRGLADVAIDGTAWTTAQAIVSKVAVLAATWVVAINLSEGDVALAALVMTITKVLCFFPPLNMGDVLIARGAGFRAVASVAARIAILWSLVIALFIASVSPLLSEFYSQFSWEVFVPLLCIAGTRVLGEALQVVPLVGLRMAFRYKRIALLDGSVQSIAAIATVTLAALGAGPWTLVVPLTLAAFAKAGLYRWGSAIDACTSEGAAQRGRVGRDFRAAGGAQYLHSLVDTAPLLIIGRFSTDIQAGLFAFSLNLAAQANAIVGAQLSGVLQPLLSSLSCSEERQAAGFTRSLRVLSSLIVPVCLGQAAVAKPVFQLVFPARWQPGASVFAVLCVNEALFFAAAPTMAYLRAQGRFRSFLCWQGIHLTVSLLVLTAAAYSWGALGVACANTLLWGISLPMAVVMALRPSGVRTWSALMIFVMPWANCAPVALLMWLAAEHLADYGPIGSWACLLIVGPVGLLVMLALFRWTQPIVLDDFRLILTRVFGKFRQERV